jgi:hypothetical protein
MRGRGDREAGLRDRRALACAALALVALAAAFGHLLSQAGERRTGANGIFLSGSVEQLPVPARATACQGGELLPAGTAALRIAVWQSTSRVDVTLSRHGRMLDRVPTRVRAGSLRVPIALTARDLDDVRVCLAFRSSALLLQGATVPDAQHVVLNGRPVESSMTIEYLRPGRRSWFQELGTVARRIGLGRGDWGGGSAQWLLAALMAGALALTGWLVLRAVVADRAGARTAWVVMAIAVLNAAAWSIVTPVFQAPDEGGHIANVQSIGETGKLPADPRHSFVSPELLGAMEGTRFGSITARTTRTTVWSPLQQRRLTTDLHAPLSRRASIYLGPEEPEPPLYYALEAVPYELGSGATLLDRIALMRLGSALLAGVTALLAFLFARECLPARPWAWTVGGLAVAFTPMLGFIGGSVNPDALLFALAAAVFLCVARAWRRGVTLRLACCAGALLAAGLLAKVNFYALVPGALLALALAARRGEGAWNGRVARLLGATVAIAAGGLVLVTAFEALAWHRPFVVGRPPAPESHVGLLSHLSYIWQVYLPRLPFQAREFPNYPAYDQIFKTFVGVFGGLGVFFPEWTYRLGAIVLVVLGALAVRALAGESRRVRSRRGELLGYAAMAGGVVALLGLSADLRRHLEPILQGRYLLPLLPLFGALLALGARGIGERWGRALGVAIVALAVAWTLYGQFQTIAFFYS